MASASRQDLFFDNDESNSPVEESGAVAILMFLAELLTVGIDIICY